MSDIRIKMAKDLRDMSDMVGDLHWMAAKAVEDLTKKEGEIAKRDEELAACRVAVENCEVFRAELAAIKAQEPVQVDCVAVMRADGDGGLEVEWLLEGGTAELMSGMYLCCVGGGTLLFEEGSGHLYAAPVSEAKAQGEYGDAYQGAREDLAIWKRRALEAEEKLRGVSDGATFMGEPLVLPYEAPREKVEALFKALGFSGSVPVGDILDAALSRIQEKPQPAAVPDVSHSGSCVTDCRSEDGITVGLIDTIINSARLLAGRDCGGAAQEALSDLRTDEDVRKLFGYTAFPAPAQTDVAGLVEAARTLAYSVEEMAFAGELELSCQKGVVIRCACQNCMTDRAVDALGKYRKAISAHDKQSGGEV